ncbi:cupredoxin domain-containing protein [Pacificispira sp.]|uniref:cupredoxin domain-containing protein n=1 Tax=Pacificispira sp. TaxID=2888761 RepID=UPI003BAC4B8C
MSISMNSRIAAAAFALALAPAAALASGGHGHGDMMGENGSPGMAADATTTVEIQIYDNYYEPEEIEVKEGETVRFVITNNGSTVHEFAIATGEMHEAHESEMQMMVDHGVIKSDSVDMEAAEAMKKSMGHGMTERPYAVLLEPGQTAELVWTFPQHADLEFGCSMPGHYALGMAGSIKLTH